MKKLIPILAFLTLIFATGCQRTDFDEILRRQENQKTQLTDHEARIKTLEALVKTANNEIATIKGLIDGLEKKVSIVSYKELADKSGYELTMSDGSKITLKHGAKSEPPVVNVKAHTDGRLYWTINGQWMLDAGGNKVPATGDKGEQGNAGAAGVTPLMRVNATGNWEMSLDGGKTWTEVKDTNGNPVPATGPAGPQGSAGQPGDANLTITETPDAIVIVYKGVTYIIPKGGGGGSSLTLSDNSADLKMDGSTTKTVYVLTGSGSYAATSDNTSVAAVSVTATNINITANNWGTATITVKDNGTAQTKTIAVTVLPKDLAVDKTELAVGVGMLEYVNITAGSGNYTVTSSHPAIATATLSGSKITINGIASGTAAITVKDTESNQTKTISVTVKALTKVVGKWQIKQYRTSDDNGSTWTDWTYTTNYWFEFKADGTYRTANGRTGEYTYSGNTLTITGGGEMGNWDNYTEISLTTTEWELKRTHRWSGRITHEIYTKI